ncbi:MAG: hypothetical protein ACR2NG_06915, partial [Acidimicrobiia bacterium]
MTFKLRTYGLMGASLFVLSLTVIVPQSQALTASDTPDGATEYLIQEGHQALADSNVEVVRPVGFGWYLATGPESLLAPTSPSIAQARTRSAASTGISPNGY